MKRIISMVLVLVFILSAVAPVMAATVDLYKESAEILDELSILKGDEDGNLMLDKNLKRQDMVILISRLYKEEKEAGVFKAVNIFKDLNKDRAFYIPYINWAVKKGLIVGMDDGNFGFNEEVTVQQFQTVLLRALGYTAEAKLWKDVPAYAKQLHIMDELSLTAGNKLTRGQMSVMVLNTLRQVQKNSSTTLAEKLELNIPDTFKVTSEAKVDANTITFSGSVTGTKSLKLHLKPISSGMTSSERIIDLALLGSDNEFTSIVRDLETGTYNYRFQSGNTYTSFQSVTIKTLPFSLKSVEANNLKEIVLSFTQAVDKNTAGFISSYSTTAGSIKDIRFEENDTKIILTLNGAMSQQGQYKITANAIKSLSGVEANIKDIEFTTFDNQIPQVVDVVQLGTKGLKIVLSEPIKTAIASNLKIDGKNVLGSVKLENNIITLTHYSSFGSTLTEGNHVLIVTGIEDFAGYKGIDQNMSFTIVKDTTAPTIKGAVATLDEVVIEFSEDIDPVSAVKTNIYWKVGSSKRYADNVRFVNNKAYAEFTNSRLSSNENTIYVENIVDYSNNKMANSYVKVTPVLDRTSPEIINYSVADDGRSIKVFYSKNVDGKNRANYTITDKNNKNVTVKDIQGSGREYTISLYNILPVGENILTIQGVADTTPLRNLMIPFSVNINMKDIEKPKVISSIGYGNNIVIEFSKPMDFSTISNPSNYYITFNNRIMYLPTDTLFTPSNDGKSVTLLLPETINGTKVMVGTTNNLKELEIRGLKDTVGNDTEELLISLKFEGETSGKANAINYYSNRSGKGVLSEENIIRIKFNIPIVQADKSDFTISGRTISYVEVDYSNEVILHLDSSENTGVPTLSIKSINSMKTYIDTGVTGEDITLLDEVSPRVKSNIGYLTTSGSNIILLPFTEALEEAGAVLYGRDLEIIRMSDGVVLKEGTDYSTTLDTDKSVLRILIKTGSISSGYSVGLLGNSSGIATYIRDTQGNLAISYGESYIAR